MKIKVITRSLDDHLPASSAAPHPLQRNLDPALHPFSKTREYTRAVTAAKMDRMFAKPFVGAIEGHQDGVYCLARDPRRVGVVAGGGGDGEVILHSLPLRRPLLKLPQAHKGMVSGVTFTSHTSDRKRNLLSCSSYDMTVKLWNTMRISNHLSHVVENESDLDEDGIGGFEGNAYKAADEQELGKGMLDEDQARLGEDGMDMDDDAFVEEEGGGLNIVDQAKRDAAAAKMEPLMVYQGKFGFNGIDHHRTDNIFATASNTVQIWDTTKSSALSNLQFSNSLETVTKVKFNQSETSVLASIGNDRTMCLYDIRTGKAERRIVMNMKSNSLAWNPTLPTVLLLASEDHNLYTFDLRKMETPTQIYKGHVAGVMSCDWSPTGEEFVSGSYDRTVRLWNRDQGRSRDTYHTKRMQRVFDTVYTPTADFVLSGSDDGNVRIWKTNASAKLGPIDTRERQSMEYRRKLREKWGNEKGVREIERQRRLPSNIKNAAALKKTMLDARKTKDDNRRRHTREGLEKPLAERKKVMVAEQH
ncbi:WD40-repeat-containing domain protein [Filobasidium floriforme]|uniref:WD40-repeat-containing domain protein n=1 Tax=Filobasidium floriforme TaxID=5210 RepID=UPI001E8E331E|nr:WD40-repeat-containing domain protein [Filobasidium floriforme]KAH8085896.1 WD40-repeat-containing domain protein [Filobasidium floriforme]